MKKVLSGDLPVWNAWTRPSEFGGSLLRSPCYCGLYEEVFSFLFFSRSACVERVDKTLRVKIRVDSFGHIAVVDSEESFVSRSACAERVTA